MAVAYESSSTVVFGSGSSITLTKPTGLAEGDLMLTGFGGAINTSSPTAPSGWTKLVVDNPASDDRSLIYYKIADSGDVAASDFTWSWSISNPRAGVIYRFSGSEAPDIFDTQSNTNVSGTGPFTVTMTGIDVTPVKTDSILVTFIHTYLTAANTISDYAVANNDPTWVEILDTYNAAADKTYASAYGPYSPASATGNLSFTNAATMSSDKVIAQLVVIQRPPATLTASVTDTSSLTETVTNPYIGVSQPTDTMSLTESVVPERKSGWDNEDKPAESTWVIENL